MNHMVLQLLKRSFKFVFSFSFQEIKEQINNLKREFSQTAQQIASTPCQSAGGCVSTTVLVALLGVQLLILISFMMYR